MTLPQAEAFAIVAAMLALFASNRLRYDVVGALALSAAALSGVVSARDAFTGFSNPVVIIIASVLVLGRAIEASGIIESALRRPLARLHTVSLQVGALTACVTLLSALMKNVGTLGVFMPIAIRTAQRSGRRPGLYLMPLAFGSLVGGTMTQIGTSPNLLISVVRQDLIGRPFHLFDFTPVGLPLALVTIVFLGFAWRLIPRRAEGNSRSKTESFASEVTLPPASTLAGRTIGELERLGGGDLLVTALLRDGVPQHTMNAEAVLQPGDTLMLQVDPAALGPLIDRGQVELAAERPLPESEASESDLATVEAVVMSESPLVGQSSSSMRLRQRHALSVLAIGRNGRRIVSRLRDIRFRPGDLLILQGWAQEMPDTLAELGLLPTSERRLAPERRRAGPIAVAILLATMAVAALQLVPVQICFFVAAVLTVLLRLISHREAYEAIDWPIVVMLGCLIPVGEALEKTGATRMLGDALTMAAGGLPPLLSLGLVLVASMLVTPFLHHAAAVLVMGPVAATVAHNLALSPDAFLMAVALGASCDFLTPIGHQNNLLVMGPGGYRFGDYWRLGLPLTCLVAVVGTLLIAWAWPLR
jgi:di/tricarboxylate transporter